MFLQWYKLCNPTVVLMGGGGGKMAAWQRNTDECAMKYSEGKRKNATNKVERPLKNAFF